MPTTTTDVVRIPYQLRHRAEIHCVAHDTALNQFVIDAIRERLETDSTPTSPAGGPWRDDDARL